MSIGSRLLMVKDVEFLGQLIDFLLDLAEYESPFADPGQQVMAAGIAMNFNPCTPGTVWRRVALFRLESGGPALP